MKSPKAIVFITVFLDLVGFGIIIPLSPYLARDYGATGFEVGLLMSVYSLMQFIFSPFWGRWSDKVGRRPILLISIFCASCSYLLFAFGTELWHLFLSRILAGFFGANISTAMAYMADLSSEEDRTKSMGLVGAAFGLGFILGPSIGGGLTVLGHHLGNLPPFGMNFSAIGAFVLGMINFFFALKYLKESLPKASRQQVQRKGRIESLVKHFEHINKRKIFLMALLATTAMGTMEATLALIVKEEYQWNLELTSAGFAYIGIVMAFTQGYLIRKLKPLWGEVKLLKVGFILAGLGLLGVGLVESIYFIGLCMTLLALGIGFANPAMSGLLSIQSSSGEQGEVLGVQQSMSSLGRILGPAVGGLLFTQIGIYIPYYLGGALMFVCFVFALTMVQD